MKKTDKLKISIIATHGITRAPAYVSKWVELIHKELSTDYAVRGYVHPADSQSSSAYPAKSMRFVTPRKNKFLAWCQTSRLIISAFLQTDVLFVFGISGAWLFPFINVFSNKKIIVNLNGIEWANPANSIFANWYLFWAESIAIQYSQIDMSDNEAIQDYTSARYSLLGKIIEPACESFEPAASASIHSNQSTFPLSSYCFYEILSEDLNRIHSILKLWSEIEEYGLVISLPSSCSAYAKRIIQETKKEEKYILLDPDTPKDKYLEIKQKATVYIYDDYARETGAALVEAMHLGLAIATYSISYNRATTESKAWYYKNTGELKELLDSMREPELQINGNHMLDVARSRYRHVVVRKKIRAVFLESLQIRRKNSVLPKTAGIQYETLLDLELAHLSKH